MKLYNYKRVQNHTILQEIQKAIGIDKYLHKDIIEGILNNYLILEEKPKAKRLFLWRFTLPFFVIAWLILFFIISPIKWFITGNYYWKYEGKVACFFDKWLDCCNL